MPPVVVMPLLLSPVIYIAGRWISSAARTLTLLVLGGVWVLFVFNARDFANQNIGVITYVQGSIAFNFDGLSLLVTFIVLFLSTLVVIYSGPDMKGQQGEEKYYAMLLLVTGSVIGLVCAGDLFNLWLWFEMTAISAYLLVAFYQERKAALAACAKYLIQTAAGSIVVLFAIALIFAQTGQLDLAQIHVPATPLLVVAGVLFVMGFGVKFALAPNYTWMPDAYAEAPTGVSALLAGIVTISALAALLRVLALLNGWTVAWGAVLIGFGMVNIVVGNWLALPQKDVKRIFAYSSISHIGFVMLALGIGLYSHQYSGFYSGMLHLFTQGIMKSLAFLAVGIIIYTKFPAGSALRIDDLKGFSVRDPITSFALVISCLSLAGIPPLAGFMSKLQIFAAGLETNNPILALLMILAALNSVFSLAYYFPIINALFQADSQPTRRQSPTIMLIPVIVLSAAVLLLGVAPGLLNGFLVPASQTLMRLFGG